MGPVWLAGSNKCVCSSLEARMAQKWTESSRLSVKWPGVESRRHAIYGWSLLVFSCSKRFFLLVLHLFRLPKPSLHKFQLDLERANTFWRVNSLHLHYNGNAEVTGSNPVEALIFFRLLLSNCLNWKIYCDDHSSLSFTLFLSSISPGLLRGREKVRSWERDSGAV